MPFPIGGTPLEQSLNPVVFGVFEILCSKRIWVTSLTFQGHVTSSVTWPFDSQYVISYWWWLESSLYLYNGFGDIRRRMSRNGW